MSLPLYLFTPCVTLHYAGGLGGLLLRVTLLFLYPCIHCYQCTLFPTTSSSQKGSHPLTRTDTLPTESLIIAK
ncbi:hypothetical protein V8C43DRAFT_293624 [Trichoderma afarasin]